MFFFEDLFLTLFVLKNCFFASSDLPPPNQGVFIGGEGNQGIFC